MKPSRLEAFSDGVFAVAITLLVFNLTVPELASGHLGKLLGNQSLSYLPYVISFLSIGICWVNHHLILDRVVGTDRELLFINLGLLLGIVSIAFTTSVATIWQNQGSDARWAVGIYCANLVFVSVTYMLLTHHIKGHEHLSSQATGVTLISLQRKGYIGIGTCVIALIVSLLASINAFLISLVLAIYYVFGVQQEESNI